MGPIAPNCPASGPQHGGKKTGRGNRAPIHGAISGVIGAPPAGEHTHQHSLLCGWSGDYSSRSALEIVVPLVGLVYLKRECDAVREWPRHGC